MADVIEFKRPTNPGNGAREALVEVLHEHNILQATDHIAAADIILADLWVRGFVVVPLGG